MNQAQMRALLAAAVQADLKAMQASQDALAAWDAWTGLTPPPPPPPPTGAPTVSLTAPHAGPVPAGQTILQATVVPVPGQPVLGVAFLVDGTAVGTDTAPPYTYSATLTPGGHVLQARVTDTKGTVASAPVKVAVADVIIQPPPPPPGTWLPLEVRGKRLQTADGKRFVFRGTNQYGVVAYLWQGSVDGSMRAVTDWYTNNIGAIAPALAALGCNMIRLPCNNDTSGPYLNSIRNVVDGHAKAGIRTLLVPFGGFGSTPSAPLGNWLGTTWVALGKPASVLFNTVNEPQGISNAQWQQGNQAEIDAIRAKGYTQPIFVDCQNWAWSLPVAEARALVAHDPQLVFMSHRYAFDGSSNRPASDAVAWTNEWSQAPDLCKGGGEVGHYNGGGDRNAAEPWLQAMMAAHVKGITDGWFAGSLSWILGKWDPGEQTSSWGLPFQWNSWGDLSRATWAKIKAVA